MTNIQSVIASLTLKAQKLSADFNELLEKSSCLLADSQSVEQNLIDCCGVQDDQLLKNLVKYCNDDERIMQLLENAELKQIVDEYKNGVKLIMDKYKYHCEGSILNERFNLRDKYIARLQEIVNNLDKRLEEMTLIMIFSVSLEEDSNKANARIIQQLTRENEQMRRQLQISNNFSNMDFFQQGRPPCTESGTQIELADDADNVSGSSDSLSSFVTCFSAGFESQSTDNSTLSET